jgi:transcription initiation factor TFIIIB Brf1 subunit/transcription initiation factor TFIIB
VPVLQFFRVRSLEKGSPTLVVADIGAVPPVKAESRQYKRVRSSFTFFLDNLHSDSLLLARRNIVRLASVLQCPEYYAETAARTFTLALSYNFTKGRKTQYVIACCLYMTCRQEKSSHMLIDFSDALNVSVKS